ncbi:hypothetical protein [Endothiovibrio diazotrophicus]
MRRGADGERNGRWPPATKRVREEKEAALMALWRALPSESHRNRLLSLLEVLVYSKAG